MTNLEEQPLSRIHQLGFAITQPEELRVERLDVLQHPADGNRPVATWPQFLRREPPDTLHSPHQVVPELLQPFGPREPPSHPHHSHRLQSRLLDNSRPTNRTSHSSRSRHRRLKLGVVRPTLGCYGPARGALGARGSRRPTRGRLPTRSCLGPSRGLLTELRGRLGLTAPQRRPSPNGLATPDRDPSVSG